MQLKSAYSQHPVRSLTITFTAWKTLLLLVAVFAPGTGYDTSTTLALPPHVGHGGLPYPLAHLVTKLVRWDAIYFVKSANRGYIFEQEWAFGWGFSRLISSCTAALLKTGVPYYDGSGALESIVAIVIAHISHLGSVLVLYHLTLAVAGNAPQLAVTAAVLHIISPAGLFLSAPYAESTCALLTFTGSLIFTKSLGKPETTLMGDVFALASGLLFGAAATFRSNGILSGLLLLEEFLRTLYRLRYDWRFSTLRHVVANGLGGLAVGIGFLLPQYIAYDEYCNGSSSDSLRPWCSRAFPSIYTFVQEHYWNVGLFRYWTISNLPLFLLATPMYIILTISGIRVLRMQAQSPNHAKKTKNQLGSQLESPLAPENFQVLRNLATSQLILALLLLTTAHAQIVTRTASAYPVWMWYIASRLERKEPVAKHFVSFMVIYAVVQGGLYASFLPPA